MNRYSDYRDDNPQATSWYSWKKIYVRRPTCISDRCSFCQKKEDREVGEKPRIWLQGRRFALHVANQTPTQRFKDTIWGRTITSGTRERICFGKKYRKHSAPKKEPKGCRGRKKSWLACLIRVPARPSILKDDPPFNNRKTKWGRPIHGEGTKTIGMGEPDRGDTGQLYEE